jgi:opacity protein-like surface antigen
MNLKLISVLSLLVSSSTLANSYFNDEAGRISAPSQSIRRTSSTIFDDRSRISPFSKDSHNLALELGQVFLVGDASKYSDSLGTRVNYTYGVSELLAFESTLAYSSHSEGKYSQLSLMSGVRMNLSNYDQMVPYVNAGIGFFRPSKDIDEKASYSATLFGLYAGAGLDLKLSKEFFFGPSIQLQNAFGTSRDTTVGRVSLGGSSINFMARAGYTF